jgi:uncharacterized protein YcnI
MPRLSARQFALGAAALLAAATRPAAAHITLETPEAAIGTAYKAVLHVPHGCAGAATTAIRVRIPEGVVAVKPMPKPGWTLAITEGEYGKSYDYYGTPTTKGVKEIAWTGGKLPDAWYDEFVFRAYLAKELLAGTTLYVPVVQDCEGGAADRWIEIPAAGKSADDYRYPAPGLRLKPGAR